MALSSVIIEPGGFDALDDAPGGVNADEASPQQLASAFAEQFGPFTEVVEVELPGSDRTLFVNGRKGVFLITADVIRDGDTVVDNELEIFDRDKGMHDGMKAMKLVNQLVEGEDVVPLMVRRTRTRTDWSSRLEKLRQRRGESVQEGDGQPGFDVPPIKRVFFRMSAHNRGWIEAFEIQDDGARHVSLGQYRTPSQFLGENPDVEVVRNYTSYDATPEAPAQKPGGTQPQPPGPAGQPGAPGAPSA
jgi:hypothetical protein